MAHNPYLAGMKMRFEHGWGGDSNRCQCGYPLDIKEDEEEVYKIHFLEELQKKLND